MYLGSNSQIIEQEFIRCKMQDSVMDIQLFIINGLIVAISLHRMHEYEVKKVHFSTDAITQSKIVVC
jgi:hypothetical protein